MTEDERAERLRRLAERRAASRPDGPATPGTGPAPAPASAPASANAVRARRPHPAAGARAVAAGAGASLLMGLVGWMAGQDAAAATPADASPRVVVVVRRSATPGDPAGGAAPAATIVEPRTVTVNAAPVRTHASR